MDKNEIIERVKAINPKMSDIDKFIELQKIELEVFKDRNSPEAYGGAYKQSGLLGIIVVLRNKLARISHFNPEMTAVKINTDDIVDQLIDMSTYNKMGMICVIEDILPLLAKEEETREDGTSADLANMLKEGLNGDTSIQE